MTPKDRANDYAAWVLDNCDHALSSDEIDQLVKMFADVGREAAINAYEDAADHAYNFFDSKGLPDYGEHVREAVKAAALKEAE